MAISSCARNGRVLALALCLCVGSPALAQPQEAADVARQRQAECEVRTRELDTNVALLAAVETRRDQVLLASARQPEEQARQAREFIDRQLEQVRADVHKARMLATSCR